MFKNVNFIENLLIWYKKYGRNLPWRTTREPYFIWISEIIFQQTRINQGIEYYINFIQKFPNVSVLANSSEEEVLKAWQGLGYYSRAHNLHRSAMHIYFELKGIFPTSYKEILKLNGVGKYTAAAIASICFEEKIPAIDGNAFRVYSRIFNSDRDISKTATFNYFFELMKGNMPENSGDFNQAIMDLGAMICLPKNPKCSVCPIENFCKARKLGIEEKLPVNSLKIEVKKLAMNYFFVTDNQHFLIQQRDKTGIWKSLFEFPQQIKKQQNFNLTPGSLIIHKLTHRILQIKIDTVLMSSEELKVLSKEEKYLLITKKEINNYAFPKPIEKFLNSI